MLDVCMVDDRHILQLLISIKNNTLETIFQLVYHENRTRPNDGLKIKLPIPVNQNIRHDAFYTDCSI